MVEELDEGMPQNFKKALHEDHKSLLIEEVVPNEPSEYDLAKRSNHLSSPPPEI